MGRDDEPGALTVRRADDDARRHRLVPAGQRPRGDVQRVGRERQHDAVGELGRADQLHPVDAAGVDGAEDPGVPGPDGLAADDVLAPDGHERRVRRVDGAEGVPVGGVPGRLEVLEHGAGHGGRLGGEVRCDGHRENLSLSS